MSDDFAQRIRDNITNLRRMVQADGGDIELVEIDSQSKVVKIRFQGACRGCPGAAMTLKNGIERNLKHAVPELQEVLAVQ